VVDRISPVHERLVKDRLSLLRLVAMRWHRRIAREIYPE
jgi:hypothetical protein